MPIQRLGCKIVGKNPALKPYLEAVPISLPPSVDNRPNCPPVYDQGDLGSCTGNALAGVVQIQRKRLKLAPDFAPSRLFIYYNERAIEGSIPEDAGASIEDGIKTLTALGVCDETLWPYDVAAFANMPNDAAYTAALKTIIKDYQQLANNNINQLKAALVKDGAFALGFTVYESFMSEQVAKTGIMPMPHRHEAVAGGHAVVAVGYDDSKQMFIVRNSWGTTWGQDGYFDFPYQYMINTRLTNDCYNVDLVSG